METDFPSSTPVAATTAPASLDHAAETSAPCLDRGTGLASAAANALDRSCKPCASGDLCRCSWLTDDRSLTHRCVTCKTPVHVWCLGKNEEGGAKTCGTCHGSLDADAMAPPPPPSWFKVVTPAPPGEKGYARGTFGSSKEKKS